MFSFHFIAKASDSLQKIIWLYIIGVILISTACNKDKNLSSQLLLPQNTPPQVDAGKNIFIELSQNSCRLFGVAIDKEKNIEKYIWRKISGPSSGTIVHPDSAVTTVKDLERGIYEFEFVAIDKKGLKGQDTVAVYVWKEGENEIFFPDRVWLCPWGCVTNITNLDHYIPANTAFEVYHNKKSASWIKIPSTSSNDFEYVLQNNNLLIYTNDPGNKPIDIRITF